ncbi:MAG: Imm50 family immunity protein [Candidatus Acidiferrales bacterium]
MADVDGADALFDWFGYWPDFHDAEILRLELNRTGESTISINTEECTTEIDAQGYYVLRKHVTVHFLLGGISDVELGEFSVQNVISGLEITRSQDGFCL